MLGIHYLGKKKWQTGVYVTFMKRLSVALIFTLRISLQPLFFAFSWDLSVVVSNSTLLL